MQSNIKDVAKYSGVSPSTVSRVLANSPRISETTRNKVLTAIKELDYHPNSAARSLVGGSTRSIGLVLYADTRELAVNSFFMKTIIGISEYSQENDYNIMFAAATGESQELTCINNYIRSRSVDGIILFANRENDQCIRFLKEQRFPFSVIGQPDDVDNCLWVDNDNIDASCNAARFLIQRGHRRIAFVCGPSGYHVTTDRLLGYKRALESASIPYQEKLVVPNMDFTIEDGEKSLRNIFEACSQNELPTAVMASDDLQALGILRALRQNRIRSVSVIGFNNIDTAQFSYPSLTSVDIKPEKLGFYAAKMLIEYLENDGETYCHYTVGSTIVERDSVQRAEVLNVI